MKNKFSHLFFCFLISLVLLNSSCFVLYPSMGYHIPSEPQLLHISEKNDIKVSGAFGRYSAKYYDGFFSPVPTLDESIFDYQLSLSAGYGFHDHFAVQSNFLFAHEKNQLSDRYFFQQTYAIGSFYKYEYFRERRRRTLKRKFIVDAYLGLGVGQVYHNYENLSNNGKLRINFLKGFTQGSISYNLGRFTELSFSSKLVYTDYLILNQFNDMPSEEILGLNEIRNRDPFFHFEISPKIRFGKEIASVYFTSTHIPYRNSFRAPYGRRESVLFGLEFNISQIRKKIKAKRKRKRQH